jgi:hypothetical protein
MAERVGFEPTVGFPLHSLSRRALSTAQTPLRSFCNRNRRFARPAMQSPAPQRELSTRERIGPGRFALATSCEERLQDRGAFLGHDARCNVDLMIEARMVEYRKARPYSPALGIVASIHQARNAGLDHGSRAHAAGLRRNVQRSPRQSIVAEVARCFPQYHHFGVRRRIAVSNSSVAGADDDLSLVHEQRADWHFPCLGRDARFLQCLLHKSDISVHVV